MKKNLKIGGQLIRTTITYPTETTISIEFPYNKALLEEVKAMEMAGGWDAELRRWVVKRSERNLYALAQLGGEESIYDRTLRPLNWPEELQGTPYDHQVTMFRHMGTYHRCIIAGEMGVGKTMSTLALIAATGPGISGPNYWWIVGPKSAKLVWRAQIAKWYPELREFDHYRLITYASLAKIWAVTTVKGWPNSIVFDECHNLKNPQAKCSAVAREITSVIPGFVVLLSGTPAPKDPTDWWSLTEICQPGFLRESTVNKLRSRLAEMETFVAAAGHQYRKVKQWIPEELALLRRRLEGMVLPILKKDCLDLPEKVYVQRQCEYTSSTQQIVIAMVQVEGKGISALNKLRQYSDGFQYQTTGPAIEFKTPKDDILLEYLSSTDRNRLVIFAGFHQSIDKIVSLAQKEGWRTIKVDGRGFNSDISTTKVGALETFQDPEKFSDSICYIGHPKSGGVTITLTASDTIIYYSNDFDGAARPQSEDRIHRIGTKGANIIDILWLPTDKYVLNNLLNKKSLQGVTIGDIQEYLATESGKFY